MTLREYLRSYRPGPFQPGKVFRWDHSAIAYWEDEESYAEQVSPELTLYRAFSDKRVVGVRIWRTKDQRNLLDPTNQTPAEEAFREKWRLLYGQYPSDAT